MKKLLLLMALVASLGGLLAWQMTETNGYVLIAFGEYSVEMSLLTLLLLLLLTWLLLRLLAYLFRAVTEPGKKLVRDSLTGRKVRNRNRTARGLLQFIEGRWDLARRNLLRSAKHADMPLLNYLAAANCAYELGDQEAVNRLLVKAEESNSGGELAIGLAQARMHLRDHHYEEALAILQRLHANAPDHPLVLRMLVDAHKGLQDWLSLEKLLPDLRRFKVFGKQELAQLAVDIYMALMGQLTAEAQRSGGAEDAQKLTRLWQDLPRDVRADLRVQETYIQSLFLLGDQAQVEALLRKALKSNWDERLVRLYGLVEGVDVKKQLLVAEGWLRERPNDPVLMLALGRLSIKNQLWGKARDYLESSLSFREQPEAYAELAKLMVQLGEHEKSTHYYQRGLALTTATPKLQ
ncbi:MAG: heme biosynthesis protein HemY [Gammaproteobacteria bacterium]|nr:MAG: heme biosynthesis protein HemY [Gammaproteobacteria bacterium]